jgi:hypothetical protein
MCRLRLPAKEPLILERQIASKVANPKQHYTIITRTTSTPMLTIDAAIPVQYLGRAEARLGTSV